MRVPAALWESLQEICWAQDLAFLRDASRILGVPEADIRRRVLGARGVMAAIVTEHAPWFLGSCCPTMVPCPGELWRRCTEPAEINGFCISHKKGKGMRYDDAYCESLPKRRAFELDGETVWVCEADGGVLTESGVILKDVRIDLLTGVCYDDRPVPPAWTKEELAKLDSEGGEED
jgi:hypothetical protein